MREIGRTSPESAIRGAAESETALGCRFAGVFPKLGWAKVPSDRVLTTVTPPGRQVDSWTRAILSSGRRPAAGIQTRLWALVGYAAVSLPFLMISAALFFTGIHLEDACVRGGSGPETHFFPPSLTCWNVDADGNRTAAYRESLTGSLIAWMLWTMAAIVVMLVLFRLVARAVRSARQ